MSEKPVPNNWYSPSMIPVYVEISRDRLESFREQLCNLELIKNKPYVLNDEIIQWILKLYKEENEHNRVFIEQCKCWRKGRLTDEQFKQIEEIELNIKRSQKINKQILFLADLYKDHTIDKILAKADAELGLDFLMGKINPFIEES